jgi:Right handed beta helix region
MRHVSTVAVLWAVLAASAGARDIYVNNVGGDDRFDGSAPVSRGSNEGPCRTIARALREARTGDRVVLANAGEPYRESVTLQANRHSGTIDHPFELVGNGAILEGAAPIPDSAWEHARGDVFRFSPSRKAYQLLFLGGRPAHRVPVEAFALRAPELEPLQWCLFERNIYFRAEPGRLPQQYGLTHAALPVGITLYEVRNVVLSDLIVQGFQVDGINAHDSVFNASLRGLKCRGNARSGISIGGASQVTITGCVVGNNGVAQVRTEGYSHTHIIDSDLLDNTAPPVVREGGRVYVEQAPQDAAPQAFVPKSPDGNVADGLPSPLLVRRTAY